ncbi:zinc metalloprotease [Microlunatus parietis]|uniref:Matrixin n=1 Tax=Microlunatus parietis TaxID=682979 RepID=A0A7Y9I265_9ACTN|nr:hypothetical protein [Microlunatus parietis]NYE68846.1 hypothetical protein [Microlunatus parietis]
MINSTVSRRGLLGLIGVGVVAGLVGVEQAHAAGVARWNRTTVHVENLLGSAWPVRAAAEAWDDSSALDLVAVEGPAPIRGTSIITVKWGQLPTGTLGYCSTSKDGYGRYKRAVITINDRIVKSYPYQLKVMLVRHEIGHALGFNHTTKRDVMNQSINSAGSPLLGYYHLDTLRRVYGS